VAAACSHRELVVAMVVSQVTAPTSKLATAKALSPDTAASSLGAVLGLGAASARTTSTPPWTGCGSVSRQWRRHSPSGHLAGGTLVLYDVSSSYVEGRCCALARLGYSRNGKKGKFQAEAHYGI
jgi:hypothetical protein